MKSMKQLQQGVSVNEHEEISQSSVRQCQTAHRWHTWKQSVQQQFKHWVTPYVINLVDAACRLQIPHFIDEYVYDLGMKTSLTPGDNDKHSRHDDL
mmetsp:Transcript_12140/g.18309  ORF Transcript_12140/g.18309 Transcript_12140/m.18309 type:complete len:96 (-) Transcript_12140:4-291(-)